LSEPARRRSLFWTLASIFFLAAVLATLAQLVITAAVLRPIEERELRAHAEAAASALARELEGATRAYTDRELDSLFVRWRTRLGDRPPWLMFQRLDGTVRGAPTLRAHWVEPLLPRLDQPIVLRQPPAGTEGPRRLELLAHSLVRRGDGTLGRMFVLQPARPEGPGGLLTSPATLMSVPLAILFSAFVGLVLVRLLVRRLRALNALAARVAEGDLSARSGDTSGDEIGELAARLDRMTERLEQARDQLKATELQRRQLFADITHELATPLTSIRAHAETLLDPGVPLDAAERTRYVQGVLEEARRLDRLIRDLFELARLEAGASPLVRERLDWVALCRNTIERFEPRFQRAGLELRWGPSEREAWLDADGHRMEQVLENLLGNALHYVPAGGHVVVSLARVAPGPPRYRLEVSDDGPGLPEAELPRVFERFYRAADARGSGTAHELGGSGLGLAILREIVERHGGRVEALAVQPRGLRIRVELPAAA
jgi:signal transduction histidine kinase